jgi:hypothetical protein
VRALAGFEVGEQNLVGAPERSHGAGDYPTRAVRPIRSGARRLRTGSSDSR